MATKVGMKKKNTHNALEDAVEQSELLKSILDLGKTNIEKD